MKRGFVEKRIYGGDGGGGDGCWGKGFTDGGGGVVLVSVAIGREKTHAATIAMSIAIHCKKADPDVPAAIARTTVLSHAARTKTQYIGLQARACLQRECRRIGISFFFFKQNQ